MKRCSHCHGTKGLHVNSRDKLSGGRIKIRYYCRTCTRERARKYRANGGMIKQREANKRWEAKNPGWRKAWKVDKKGKT